MGNRAFSSFEIMRHGEKKDDRLSETGKEQAKQKAGEILEEIDRMPSGSVITLFSSNIGRAIDTKSIIETELRTLSAERPEIELVGVRDLKKISKAKSRTDKKFIITDTAPQTRLGWTEEDPSTPALLKYLKMYGDESVVGKIWIAHKNELPDLKKELQRLYPEIDSEGINPSEFVVTPEEYALNYVKFLKRINAITEKHFPGRPTHVVNVGHNYHSDFLMMTALEMPLNAESVEELGNKFRDYAESSYITVEGDLMSAQYRNKKLVGRKSLNDIAQALEENQARRKEEWEDGENGREL